MIFDAHTHVFPRSFIDERDRLARDEPVFAELYASPRARMATDAELSAAMDVAGVERAVIAGFAWADVRRCVAHNDALLDAAARSGGRLIALCCVPAGDPAVSVREMERCVAAGAMGFGELRLSSLGAAGGDDQLVQAVAQAAASMDAVLMLHASEPVGHAYPGKTGGPLADVWGFVSAHAGVTAILAHLGGGLPFYAHMPEVRAAFDRVYVDTAAVPWLYERTALRTVIDLIGHERLLFGSDFPLRHPRQDLRWLRATGLERHELAAVLGDNASALFERGGTC
ncbi:MAG: amidohydrolase family protein [Dehalococcoidia bacterium]